MSAWNEEKKNICSYCHKKGHDPDACPSLSISVWGGGVTCDENNNIKKDDIACFNCGEFGHWSRDCRNNRQRTSTSGDGSPEEETPPPENYIPNPLEDNELYETGISRGINFDKYTNDVVVIRPSSDKLPPPIDFFEHANFSQILLRNIRKCRYSQPTPIQRYGIPLISQGHDLMACAQTGSGKTAAFLLPILNDLLENGFHLNLRKLAAPEVLIIGPTRELVTQICNESRKFSMSSNLKNVVVYGGTSVQYQRQILRDRVNVLAATPGRLLHYINNGDITFKNLRFLILDEADRMLDMGFMEDVDDILKDETMPNKSERQTLLFSATFPEKVRRIASEILNPSYYFLRVGVDGGACTDIKQTFHCVRKEEKRGKLIEIFNTAKEIVRGKTLIFVREKKMADFLAVMLREENFPATSIHGDRMQREREMALRNFQTGKTPILFATNVAARGLDIPNIQHVINYDLPTSVTSYVHRIGRSGRIGNVGCSISFFDPDEDKVIAGDLVEVLEKAQQPIPSWLQAEAEDYLRNGINANKTDGDEGEGTIARVFKVSNQENSWD